MDDLTHKLECLSFIEENKGYLVEAAAQEVVEYLNRQEPGHYKIVVTKMLCQRVFSAIFSLQMLPQDVFLELREDEDILNAIEEALTAKEETNDHIRPKQKKTKKETHH